MKRFAVAVLLIIALAACGDDQIIELPTGLPDTPLISGGWQGVVTSSTLPNAVWTMTLTQESVAASGSWADDVNLLDGTVSVSITPDGTIIGTMTLNTRPALGAVPTCTASTVVRGVVSGDSMAWTAEAWQCAGAPVQARMDWRRTQ